MDNASQELTPTPSTSDSIVPNIVAVVGPFRSGTSCVAGILHTLGVSMGRQFFRGEVKSKSNPKGFFEAKYLQKAYVQMYCEPLMQPLSAPKDRVRLLRDWAAGRSGDGNPIGAKHPALCLMVPEMIKAWPGVKIVTVTRDVNAASASLEKAGWWSWISTKRKQAALQRMIDTRDADIERLSDQVPVLRLDFAEVLADPQQAVERLVAFAGISPSPEQIAAAVAFVDPSLNHNRRLSVCQRAARAFELRSLYALWTVSATKGV